jgi:basic membrane protein A and related proteins
VEIGEITDAVPADVKAEAEAMRDAIAAGTYHPFTGPINKQDGSPWLAEGARRPDGDLAGHELLCRRHHGRNPEVTCRH